MVWYSSFISKEFIEKCVSTNNNIRYVQVLQHNKEFAFLSILNVLGHSPLRNQLNAYSDLKTFISSGDNRIRLLPSFLLTLFSPASSQHPLYSTGIICLPLVFDYNINILNKENVLLILIVPVFSTQCT